MVGPESVASELIDVVALEGIIQSSHKVNTKIPENTSKRKDLNSDYDVSPTAI